MSPVKAIIYAGVISVFVLLPAFLFTTDEPITIVQRPSKYLNILGQFLIFSTLAILVVLAVVLVYGLIAADPNSKYPTLQPWISLRELYVGSFKSSWEN